MTGSTTSSWAVDPDQLEAVDLHAEVLPPVAADERLPEVGHEGGVAIGLSRDELFLDRAHQVPLPTVLACPGQSRLS
jgi:hypothetical protein